MTTFYSGYDLHDTFVITLRKITSEFLHGFQRRGPKSHWHLRPHVPPADRPPPSSPLPILPAPLEAPATDSPTEAPSVFLFGGGVVTMCEGKITQAHIFKKLLKHIYSKTKLELKAQPSEFPLSASRHVFLQRYRAIVSSLG